MTSDTITPPLSTPSHSTHLTQGTPLGGLARAGLLAWILFLIAGFGVAALVAPDSRGYGTHQQLGLPPCTFRDIFQIPCPSCGMTTSFSNFVRGRFVQSFQANPAGLLLAAFCAVQIPWGLASAWRKRLLYVTTPDVTLLVFVLAICAVCIVNWIVAICSQ